MKKYPFLILLILLFSYTSVEGVTATQKDTNLLLSIRGKYIKAYLKKHPNTPEEIKNKMLSGRVDVGMDAEQVIAVTNKPSEVIIDPSDKAREKWVYSGTNKSGFKMAPDTYYYFENGTLVGYENEEHIKERKEHKKMTDYISQHPERPKAIMESLSNNKVTIGMTKEEVELSFGKPVDINRTVTKLGTTEQWVYGYDIGKQQYLYFENGVLTSWQD